MSEFLTKLDRRNPLKILDVGSQIATGQTDSYKSLMSDSWEYQGLDLSPGKNVDIVAEDPFNYPIDDEEFDIIISGQCVEHVSNPFLWIEEFYRILKSRGQLCIIVPSAGPIHRAPPGTYDYWRILPDGMDSLLKFAGFTDIEVNVSSNKPWQDCVGIARKS